MDFTSLGNLHIAQPLGLLGLLSLPVILWLYRRRARRVRVAVSSNALWHEALRERERRDGARRLPRDLSLYLLLAAAALASLALARPGWVTAQAQAGSVVVLIDTSASMRAGTRMADAVTRVRTLLDGLADDARVMLADAGARPRPLAGFDATAAQREQALATLVASDEAGAPETAIEFARALVRGRDDARIVFVTDAAFDVDDAAATLAGVKLLGVGSAVDNVALTRFVPRAAGSGYEALVSVHNHSATARKVALGVSTRDGEYARADMDVAANASAERVLQLPAGAGPLVARIVSQDAHPADDAAYAVAGRDAPLHIARIGAEDAWLDAALGALPAVDVAAHPMPSDGDTLTDLARAHDIVVFNGAAPERLPRGRYLLIDALPADLPLRATGVVERVRATGQRRDGWLRDVDLGRVLIARSRLIEVSPGATGVAVLAWSDRTPLLFDVADAGRRAIVVGFDPARSTLPRTVAYPLLIAQVVDALAPRERREASTAVAAGTPIRVAGIAPQAEVVMRAPDGEASFLDASDGSVEFVGTRTAGLYRLQVDGVARHFAVNTADSRESDLRPRAAPPSIGAEAGGDATAARTRPLWPLLSALALALLAFDWWLRLGRRQLLLRLRAVA